MTLVTYKINLALQRLNEIQQTKLLDFIECMVGKLPTVSANALLSFAGSIPTEDLHLMQSAIQHDCSQIDAHEW